ncbi:MAG: ferritin-like domain-containing protein [Planctomycetia bacterium]|nr:ferritin-like domain-containing protein [Planctomycetia bacterium]
MTAREARPEPADARPGASQGAAGAVAVDVGDLAIGGGALAILRPALDLVTEGGVVTVASVSPAFAEDVASWCRAERHVYLGAERLPDGRAVHRVARGPHGAAPAGGASGGGGAGLALRRPDGTFLAADVLAAVPFPAHADPATGFAPRGARVEPGGPPYPVDLLDRDRLAPPETARLYDQAVAAQWDATRDVPWDKVATLPVALERALGQVMTFLAENELSALWVPAKFLPRLHPAYAEVAMLLAVTLADEARHVDVFLKRARAGGGGLGVSHVTTSRSLLSLLQQEDFTEAMFLLSVLGEGTFLDLLRFVEVHAPDEATSVLVGKARADEARHVHFGLAHVRHALAHDPALYDRLEAAVRRRAATMGDAGVPASVQDALTVLAAHGDEPAAVRTGHAAFRELLEEMGHNRVRRLVAAGFTVTQARTLSDLHTPNFM